MKRAAFVGLMVLTASAVQFQAAQAQTPDGALARRANGTIGGPLGGTADQTHTNRGPNRAPDLAPANGCSLVSKAGVQTPLTGFDPAKTSTPLPAPQAKGDAQMVLCDRATLVPQLTDYRVLTEMHLPLAIRVGSRLLVLGAQEGRFQVSIARGAAATPSETDAFNARLAEMQTAAGGAAPQ